MINGEYRSQFTKQLFQAWTASRAAIEVELPEATAYWNGTKGNEVLNHRQLIADTADAIRDAGIQVKE